MKVEKPDVLKFKLLNEGAMAPTRAHEGDLGYDLYASDGVYILPNSYEIVHTGTAFQFPPGWGGLLKDRSSMASEGLTISGGVIDNGYTGEIMIVINNLSDRKYTILRGDKIAQMVLVPVANFDLKEVDELIAADDRGDRGFGSTGK